jgi:predicted MPP superfamily phosphohydrolase
MMSIATVYYVSGNQENASGKYDELKSDLQSVGVRVLDNEFIKLSKNNETINLFGIEDFDFFNFGPDTGNDFSKNFQGEITNLVKGADGFKILLTHRPEYFDQYVACNIDLVFAGHAHGGQVRLPFIGALYAPGQGFFPKYTKGLYTIDQTSMIVSAGMGNSEFPFRINDPPEIVVAILHTN